MTTRKLFPVAAGLAAAGLIVGCGPLDRPMPPRLSPDSQKEIDAAWDAALSPVGKYDRRQWLDALVGTQAYQAGVDTLAFRSEKRFAGGTVVMELVYDRARPDADRFTVTVLDKAGKRLRQETYSRADVEDAARDLFDPTRTAPPQLTDPPELAKQRAEIEGRWKRIAEMMPGPKTGK